MHCFRVVVEYTVYLIWFHNITFDTSYLYVDSVDDHSNVHNSNET